MAEIYKVIKLNHLQGHVYEVIIETETTQTITLTIHEELVLKYRLVKGKEVPFKLMPSIYEQLGFGNVYQEALKILGRRAYTVAEIKQKLVLRNFEITLIEETLSKLEEMGLLNDEQYARSYIRHHSQLGKKGPHLLKEELLQKEVSEQIIDQQLSMYTNEAQLDYVKKAVNQQLRVNKKYGSYVMKQKIYQHLVNKGFSTPVIKEVLNDVEFNHEQESSVLITQMKKLFYKYKTLPEYDRKMKLIQALLRKGFNYDEILRAYEELEGNMSDGEDV